MLGGQQLGFYCSTRGETAAQDLEARREWQRSSVSLAVSLSSRLLCSQGMSAVFGGWDNGRSWVKGDWRRRSL